MHTASPAATFFAELHHGFYLFVYKGTVANLFSLVAHSEILPVLYFGML